MARLPIATRESVPEDQRDDFDDIVQSLGSVPQYGPGSALIHVPAAARLQTGLNDYLRYESSLPNKVRELAMLVTAREMDCEYIWNAHAGLARNAGVPDHLVDGIRDKKELEGLAPDEVAVLQLGRELLRTHHASRGAFQAGQEQFGLRGVVELVLILGDYSQLALVINAFDTDLPPNRTEPLLPI